MFVKPFRIKTSSQVKGSDRKKMKADLKKSIQKLTDDDLNVLMNKKDEMTTTKIVTYAENTVLVYCVNKIPIFFEYEKVYYPTVYTLWKCPDLLPIFITTTDVIQKFQSGADLMLPGVILTEEFGPRAYGKLELGDRVAVNTDENVAPIAIGTAALSSYDMFMCGKRGKCVYIGHVYGDHLWAMGPKTKPPELGPSLQPLKSVTNDSNVLVDDGASKEDMPEIDALNLSDNISDDPVEPELPPEDQLSPVEEMDKLIKYCFQKAWNTTAKKIPLPLLASQFYAMHILPACPKNRTIDVKKSSFKKFSKFLEIMQKEDVLQVKEMNKGVASIVKFNPAHPIIKSFEELPEYEYEEEEVCTEGDGGYTPPVIQEVHIITAAVMPLFIPCGYKKGDSVTMVEVRKCLTEYVKREGLQSTENKSYVKLNPFLTDCALNKAEYHSKSELKWDELTGRCTSKMTPSFRISFLGKPAVLVRGKLEPIDISVATRTGNKKVTIVHNLEVYGIDHSEFARKCRVGVQASATIGTLPDKKGPHVLIQGNQVVFVAKILQEEYLLNKRYLKGLENAPKKKK